MVRERFIFLTYLCGIIGLTVAASLLPAYYLCIFIPSILLLILAITKRNLKLVQDIKDYSASVYYKDFTRHYIVKNPKSVQGELYQSFNQINSIYKDIASAKELQYQYLNQIVNMLDTAIISYQPDSGQVVWVNDAFKTLFNIPYVHLISGLAPRNKKLYEETLQLKPGVQHIVAIPSSKGIIKLLLQLTEFQTAEGRYSIVLYQNVNAALDETESKAWQKLLRVLTHEIMNSIGPISSLAETMNNRLTALPHMEELTDVRIGADTIKKRSDGLLKFAKNYRTINHVDEPLLEEFLIADLFENIYQLLEPTLTKKGIELDLIMKNTRLTLQADINLMEQVILNLLLNAMEAVKDVEQPYITLSAILTDEGKKILVQDNGVGISAELMENIFTPFFTTRKTGSGVGLTLSKQIMLIHKGHIWVESEEGKGTTFTLQF